MTKLGLPLEYQTIPEFFDAWNVNESTDRTNCLVERLLRQSGVESVLDMTCGTGSQVFYLKERGYNVVGSDFSPPLLEIARDKAKRMNYDLKFIYGDMRTLKVGKFDSVVTIFNAVGHVTREDFLKTMENINSNLNVNGLYIFDIFNLDAMNNQVVANFAYQVNKKVDGMQLLHSKCSTIDRKIGLLTSYDQQMVQKGSEKPILYENVFSLQIYKLEELQEMLHRTGFEVISVCDINGDEFSRDTSTSMLIVAKKILEV